MKILGITGSIGMGKTTVAGQFGSLGVPVFDADKITHDILVRDEVAIRRIAEIFPNVVEQDKVNRQALGDIVFHDETQMKQLEALLHPLILARMEAFITEHSKKKVVLLDIPLLFQTGWDARCDYTIRVVAPRFIQRFRVMKRPHMTRTKFDKIVASQKNEHVADFTIQTGGGMWYSMRQVKRILARIS